MKINFKFSLFSFFSFLLLSFCFVFTERDLQARDIASLASYSLQIRQAEEAFANDKAELSAKILNRILPILQELTELHSDLYRALKDQESARETSEREKEQTIEFGKLRDRGNFLAGKIALLQGDSLEAVKYFVLVVESQRTTVLGERAYEQLRQIGFSPRLSLNDR